MEFPMKSEDNVFAGWKMEPNSKSIKQSKMENGRNWTPKPILSPEFTEDPPLHEVYVGILKEKRQISTAIPSISSAVPGFHHLKRCSSNKLLLAPVRSPKLSKDTEESIEEDDSLTEENLKSSLKEKGFDISVLEDNFQIIKVPSRAPKTKAQAARVSKIWPVNFHPDPNIEALIDGSIFEEHHLNSIENYTRLAIEAAKLEAIGNSDCNGAAVIVDPDDGKILTIAASRMDLHPMWHASMIAVDLVAKLQGGGAWDFRILQDEETSSKSSLTSCDDESQDSMDKEKIIKRKYKEEAPIFYPESLSQLRLPVYGSLNTSVRKGRKNSPPTKSDAEGPVNSDATNLDKSGPYLCTGYWAFLFKEPCPLCAMALLHSRILRIFYSVPNGRTGILGSKAILHAIPGLNHRYQVWSGILEEESRETARIIEQRSIS